MAAIKAESQTIYLAPSKGRRYLSARSAANAEARAMLDKKYPIERPEYESGHLIFAGWHWSNDPFLDRVHKRLSSLILKQARKTK